MATFGIIAEGLTDQYVIENLLRGFFESTGEAPVVNYVQPPLDATGRSGEPAPAGWTLVFRALAAGEHRKALQFNDYLVLQIDTDVCKEKGFDVPRREGARELSPEDLAERVAARLRAQMGEAFCETYKDKLLFAVAVDSTECWLLPLLYPGYPDSKARKITGCLQAANHALEKANRNPLSSAEHKHPRVYDEVSRPYARHKELQKHHHRNPSLACFLQQLEAVRRSTRPATNQ
jgi:hypothetical protein